MINAMFITRTLERVVWTMQQSMSTIQIIVTCSNRCQIWAPALKIYCKNKWKLCAEQRNKRYLQHTQRQTANHYSFISSAHSFFFHQSSHLHTINQALKMSESPKNCVITSIVTRTENTSYFQYRESSSYPFFKKAIFFCWHPKYSRRPEILRKSSKRPLYCSFCKKKTTYFNASNWTINTHSQKDPINHIEYHRQLIDQAFVRFK